MQYKNAGKHAGLKILWNRGASGSFSTNIIGSGSNGWVEFNVCDTAGSYMIGLGVDPPNSTTSLSYKGPKFTSTDDYKVFDLAYDLNGNITTLKRNGYLHPGSSCRACC